jgi:UDP-3-O-[3-hydroxymyristoyl] glucosamine N-acyltransferase
VRIGDFVAIGGQAGIAGHVTLGDGARIAAQSGVHSNVPAGASFGGYPAQPANSWAREVAMLHGMVRKRKLGRPAEDG